MINDYTLNKYNDFLFFWEIKKNIYIKREIIKIVFFFERLQWINALYFPRSNNILNIHSSNLYGSLSISDRTLRLIRDFTNAQGLLYVIRTEALDTLQGGGRGLRSYARFSRVLTARDCRGSFKSPARRVGVAKKPPRRAGSKTGTVLVRPKTKWVRFPCLLKHVSANILWELRTVRVHVYIQSFRVSRFFFKFNSF